MTDETPDRYGNENPPSTCAQEYNCYHPHCLCPIEGEGEEGEGEE